MQDFAKIATHLADEAAIIARKYFRQPYDVTRKGDDSPVTIADQQIEARLREILAGKRPDDGILGEEFDNIDSKSGYTWVIDPIDGTKSFIMGRPTFGTLIALWKDDKPVLGLIDQPILNERWLGIAGQTSTFNGEPISTRKCPDIADAVITSTTPAMFDAAAPVYQNFETGCRLAWGGDCYSYGLLASGHVDIVVEADLKPFDYAALIPIIEGAGGFIRDWQGQPLTLHSKGEIIALGDEALWQAVQDKLKG